MPGDEGSAGGLDAYARALAIYERYRGRRRAGNAEDEAQFLAEHSELRNLLVPMLAAGLSQSGPVSGAEDAPTWTGLPDAGDDFGLYHIERRIGAGGMGSVFLAQHRELGRKVALKLILPERLYASIARERFWREAKSASRLDHPNICPVYEVGEVAGIPFMAMRFVEGETLAALIARAQAVEEGAEPARPPSVDAPSSSLAAPPTTRAGLHALLLLFEKLALALHYAHEQGIVHRDVKPANVLVAGDGEPIILDFGLARDEDSAQASLTMTGELLGTPLYMSPEQIAPRGRKTDRTTDVYSLGVTLYECLTLRRPFGGTSMQELCQSILSVDPVRPSRVNRRLPRDLDVIVEKAIDKDRERRYGTAGDFAADLRRLRSLQPIHARRAGPVLRARRWAQRNPRVATFLGVLVFALVVITKLLLRSEQLLSDFDALGDTYLVRQYEQRALDELLPFEPGTAHDLQALRAWLLDAEALIERTGDKRERIARLQRRARTISAADAVGFDNPRDELLYDSLVELLHDLEGFGSPTGVIAKVRRHIAWYEGLRARTIDDAREVWDVAIAAIADRTQCPRYDGLRLEPQLGLLPLRCNAETGLWEFRAVHPDGEQPRWNEDGRLANPEQADPVLILLPGGTFWMGSQRDDENAPNYYKEPEGLEKPAHEVTLAPFFISKYELSQGQWRRLTNENPSLWSPDYLAARKQPGDLGHPVERVSWQRADRELRSWGLLLPSEAQWEYAARGETQTPWWSGATADTLAPSRRDGPQFTPRANYSEADAYTGSVSASAYDKAHHDGWALPAPVDSFAANPFGVHHMLGNVWEWCADPYLPYPGRSRTRTRHRDGDGLLMLADDGSIDAAKRTVRGGGYTSVPEWTRSAFRLQRTWTTAEAETGVRPARLLVH